MMKRFLVAGWATGCCCLGAFAAEAPLWQQPSYAAAIMRARAGEPTQALEWIEQQRLQGPLPMPLFDDYLTLLIWSGRGAEALQQVQGHEGAVSKDTLSRLARAARDQPNPLAAVRLYQRLVRDDPTTFAHRAGLAMAQVEAGQAAAAVATLEAVHPLNSNDALEWLRARVYVALQADDLFLALDMLQRARQQYADDRELDRLYLLCLLRLKLPAQAQAASKAMPTVDPALAWQIESDRAAILSRWGRIETHQLDGPARFSQTDAALAANATLATDPLTAGPAQSRQLEDDRLQMLQQRGASAAVVALGQRRSDEQWSPYARAAMADAYLTLRQPQRAVLLYRSALEALPSDRRPQEWREGLVYALLESGQYDACRQEMSALRNDVPRTVRDAAGRVKFNSQFLRVELLQAMVQAFMDDPRAAWSALEAIRQSAPADHALRLNRGAVALMRGWPRRARAIYQQLLVDDPQNRDALTGLGEAALDVHDPERAAQYLDRLRLSEVDSQALRSLQERWRDRQRPLLVWDVARDVGSDPVVGGDHAWASKLQGYSADDGHWRLQAFHVRQEGRYVGPEQQARFEQLGLGFQHRAEAGIAQAGLTAQTLPAARSGAFAGYEWTPDDHWVLGLTGASDSAEVPLKGRLSGTQGYDMQWSVNYRRDESRELGVRWSILNLSDGNRRRTWSAQWDERWISGPRQRISTVVGLSASRNDAVPEAAYFNPSRDAAWWLSAQGEWPFAVRYDARWALRVQASVGGYWQQGYGSGAVHSFALEAQRRDRRGSEWRTGWSLTRRPYDGVAESFSSLYVHWERRW